jgi:predicted dienelactone hydrolase
MAENARAGGPLAGKIDLNRLGVMGHSMGGGGTLIAGNTLGSMVKALVPLQPWSSPTLDAILGPGAPPSIAAFPKLTAATLIIASENDELATKTEHAIPFYESIVVTKAYAEIKGGTHMAGTDMGPMAQRVLQARLALAWMKIYLENDTRYNDYIYGAKLAEVMAQLAVFKAPPPK